MHLMDYPQENLSAEGIRNQDRARMSYEVIIEAIESGVEVFKNQVIESNMKIKLKWNELKADEKVANLLN
jgi:hypothetical protein